MVGEKDMQLQAYSRQLHELHQTPFGRIISKYMGNYRQKIGNFNKTSKQLPPGTRH